MYAREITMVTWQTITGIEKLTSVHRKRGRGGPTTRFFPVQQYVSLFFARELVLATCLRHLAKLLPRARKFPCHRFSHCRIELFLRYFDSALTMIPVPRPSPRRGSLTEIL